MQSGQILGLEDIIFSELYNNSVQCLSNGASVYQIPSEVIFKFIGND